MNIWDHSLVFGLGDRMDNDAIWQDVRYLKGGKSEERLKKSDLAMFVRGHQDMHGEVLSRI